MKKIIQLIKKDTVLSVAALLAVISMFFVFPDRAYLDYIDFRTLAVLFCLMTVMAGFQKLGIFKRIAGVLLNHVQSLWQLMMILIMMCFFFSMIITNDVALITFVPLTLTVIDMLEMKERHQWVIPIVVMQTIAANLGSMMTPIGNPQNLYLYSQSGVSPGRFFVIMAPYTLAAFLMLLLWSFGYCRKRRIALKVSLKPEHRRIQWHLLILYLILFMISLLVVARVIPYLAALILVLLTVLILDRETLTHVDYPLLLTFIAFFIFIGNMGRIPAFQTFLQNMIYGHEMTTSVAASQVISNVPAALLLSGFTDQYESLIIGTNIGGLGTLIASMASLISYKLIAKYNDGFKGQYFKYFTFYNIVFLVIELAVYALL